MLKLENITVSYNNKTNALEDVYLNIEQGEFIGIIGLSGSGKSTLLKAINLLVRPERGKIFIGDKEITSLNTKDLLKIRREIGFVFQDYNLIDRLSVLENVLVGRLGYKSSFKSTLGLFDDEDYQLATKALNRVGLTEKMFERGDQLSGGQKQRVAIAKILCQNPKIILADEPVSSLDQTTSSIVMDYFKIINEKKNKTIIVNLHDVNLAKKYCNRIIALKDGRIVFDGKVGDIDDRLLEEIYHQE